MPVDLYAKRLPASPEAWLGNPAIRAHAAPGRDWNRYRGVGMALALLPVLVRRERPVVVASTWQHAEWLVRLRPALPFTLVCFAHGTDITKGLQTSRRRRLERVLRRTDLFAPVSRFLERLVRDRFPDLPTTVRVIPNGIDTDLFRPRAAPDALRTRFALDPRDTILLSVGRTIEAKGFRFAIRALAQLQPRHPRLRLVIAGTEEEPEAGTLKSLVRELGLEDSVRFLSAVPYAELPALYGACDLFVLASHPVQHPSYQEDNFPMVLLEAGACGRAAVATRCGGIPEIVEDRVTGLVAPHSDAEALASAIETLLRNPDLRRSMGQAARKRIETLFTLDVTVARLLEALAELP